jgi:regulator of cell morphogenesis and NO signaling
MELEHDEAENDLDKLRKLTDNYTPPDWANDTYREMVMALAQLESDMQVHVYKEDNVLFPRALRRQSEFEETRSGPAITIVSSVLTLVVGSRKVTTMNSTVR